MGKINSHRDLVVWQRAMDLAEIARRLARLLPRPEATAIVFQMARRLGYLDVKQSGPALDLVAEISKMLTVLRARAQASGAPAAERRPL